MSCTATLVGRRHIIAASHCATWGNFRDDSPPINPLIFHPGYNQKQIYKPARVIYTYWLRKLDESRNYPDDYSGDWLVGVLDRYVDTTNGQFGQQLYDHRWTGDDSWNMIGYPNDFIPAGGVQVFQGPSAIQAVEDTPYGEVYKLDAVGKQGDSGGPIYGTFQGLPRLIGTTALALDFTVKVHGGLPMFGLIAKAIAEYP